MRATAVVVFAKAPRAGAVKTRLCPPLSPAGAARLYRCFLLDTLDRVQAVRGVTPAVAYAPRDARAFFAAARPGMLLVSQGGGDLGARMARVVGYLVARGFAAVVIVGADSPTLPLRHLRTAIRLLGTAAADGVIGPSEDGGYYLIGLRAPWPALFAGVSWGTGRVLAQTLAKARRAGYRFRLLPAWYDVDTVADLHRLAAELRRRRGPAPRTRRLLGTRAWRAWYHLEGGENGAPDQGRPPGSGYSQRPPGRDVGGCHVAEGRMGPHAVRDRVEGRVVHSLSPCGGSAGAGQAQAPHRDRREQCPRAIGEGEGGPTP